MSPYLVEVTSFLRQKRAHPSRFRNSHFLKNLVKSTEFTVFFFSALDLLNTKMALYVYSKIKPKNFLGSRGFQTGGYD